MFKLTEHNQRNQTAIESVGETRHVAGQQSAPTGEKSEATTSDDERQATTGEGDVPRYVARLEREVEQAKDERDFLREQIDRKDKTIDALIERDRETNFLVRGLQEMLTPLLGSARRERPIHENNNP